MTRRSVAAVAIHLAACLLIGASGALAATDWMNSGGNAGRNGLSDAVGPATADLAWSGGRSSLIAWHPVTEGDRVFMVRQYAWPASAPNDAWVVAMSLTTGDELWAEPVPADIDDWTPWIAGARDGRVYVSRGGNGASVSAPMLAYDAASGDILWTSNDEVDAGAYDGVVYAPDGDLLVASFRDIWRLESTDGSTVWHASRSGSVSGSCGGCRSGDAFYVADAAPGGTIIVRFDVASGMRMHSTPVMPGFTLQNTPMAGPDGTVYLARTQNNPSVDFYYAFTDTGSDFVERWSIPAAWGTNAEFGIGPDGSLYLPIPGPRLARIDPADGSVIDQTPVLTDFSKARIAVDASGHVYYSNGGFADGHLYAYEDDLTPLWDVAVTNINIGGPSLAADGTLVVCGVGTDVRAYRGAVTAIAAGAGAPPTPGLVRCAPSPFRTSTEIRFRLDTAAPVTLAIYDVRGQRVRTLLDRASRVAGEHAVAWTGRDDAARPLPSGLYLFRLEAGALRASGRTLLVR
jgi:hypothetical protein